MRNALALVLGGGRGSRLAPLTSIRSKPAVPLAGMYRLIHIPISNCLNSGINRVFVLTQFMSVSLHSHIRGAYSFDNFSGGFVELLAAQETPGESTAIASPGDRFDRPGRQRPLSGSNRVGKIDSCRSSIDARGRLRRSWHTRWRRSIAARDCQID